VPNPTMVEAAAAAAPNPVWEEAAVAATPNLA